MPVMLADSVHVEGPQSDSFMLQANIVNSRNAVNAPRRGCYQIKMRVLNWACFLLGVHLFYYLFYEHIT